MDFKDSLIAYRRELHRNPEVSFKEFETTKRIKRWLREMGVEIIDTPLEIGVLAEIKGGQPGPTIALRSDIDALPMQEQSGLEFASVNDGVAHCCGHDTHMTVILGAAKLLQERRDQLKGNVRLIFQPAEETCTGAPWFLERVEALKGVKAIFGLHNKPDLPVGTLGIKPGPLMASCDHFIIEVNGKGGHGGMPHNCIDPIVAGAQLVNNIQTIVSRKINSLDNVVVSITRFQAGTTWNIIPDKAIIEGTVRSFQEPCRKMVEDQMRNICQGIALASGTEIDFNWDSGIPAVDNSPCYEKLVTDVAVENGLKVVVAEQNLASEDFSSYLGIIPGFYIFAGSEGPYQWHHPQYTINEDFLEPTAKYMASLAEKALLEG